MSGRKRILQVVCVLAVVLLSYSVGPLCLFDTSRAAYDEHTEWHKGKTTAWGPQPLRWLIYPDTRRTTFRGDEWYFQLFRPFCVRWVERNGYILPPDWRGDFGKGPEQDDGTKTKGLRLETD